eukprot:764373-Hanusia_phi.AAC.3
MCPTRTLRKTQVVINALISYSMNTKETHHCVHRTENAILNMLTLWLDRVAETCSVDPMSEVHNLNSSGETTIRDQGAELV